MCRAIKSGLFLAAMAAAIAGAPGAGAADAHSITVSAAVLSKNNCRFSTAASALALAIDPASSANASASTTLSIRCTGSAPMASWSLSHNNGLHGSSPAGLRMQHQVQAAEYLAYSLSYPGSGTVAKNVWQDIVLTATVLPGDFADAIPGTYDDTVTLSLLP